MKNIFPLIGLAIFSISSSSYAATVAIGAGTYTENFNILAASQEPAAGWDIRRLATETALGSKRTLFATAFAWSDDGGAFKNVSSTNIAQTSDATTQAANTDRALAVNQVPTFGNPGASFNFNFSSAGILLNSISIDMLLLQNVQASTTLSLQYGIGANPTSFTTLATWSDLSVAGGWGSTTLTFDRDDFGSNLDNQSQAWFRVVALTPAVTDGSSGAHDQMAIDNFSISAAAVPEPSVIALGLLGVFGVLGARRR